MNLRETKPRQRLWRLNQAPSLTPIPRPLDFSPARPYARLQKQRAVLGPDIPTKLVVHPLPQAHIPIPRERSDTSIPPSPTSGLSQRRRPTRAQATPRTRDQQIGQLCALLCLCAQEHSPRVHLVFRELVPRNGRPDQRGSITPCQQSPVAI